MPRIHWLDVVLAPLFWLEQARGRRRLLLLGLYGLILSVGGVLVGREAVLWQLPDASEPFDLARYGHVALPDSDNAMVRYAQAAKLLVNDTKVSADDNRLFLGLRKGVGNEWDWEQADSKVRAWAGSNRTQLDLWLRGTECLDSLAVQPERSRLWNLSSQVDTLRTFARLGILEATRRQAEGDLPGAWVYYRAVIRSGLHAGRHAGMNESFVGSDLLRLAVPKALGWVEDSRVTPDLLRQANADLVRCRTLATSPSNLVRVEYFATQYALIDPLRWEVSDSPGDDQTLWYNHIPGVVWATNLIQNEPKRSLKILRLITAGQLAQCDRPVNERARLISPRNDIYAIDAATPPNLARINPETLAAWAEASRCRGLFRPLSGFNLLIELNGSLLDHLRLCLAERAYKLDHGDQPAKTYADLFPAYLDVLPSMIGPGDPLAAP